MTGEVSTSDASSEIEESAGSAAEVARVAARLSSTYVLRTLQLLAQSYGGDLLTGIVAQAIVAANTAHLDDLGRGGERYAGVNESPPDALRRPVSVLRLATSLGLPFETTRRYVNKLVQAGYCVKVSRGVIVPRAVLEQPAMARAIVTNVAYARRFVRELRRAGVVE